MSDATGENRTRLLDRIIAALEKGGRLTDALLDYIDACLFTPEPGRLAAFLKDDTDSERDSLLDLIFFPDQAVQIDLEPLLEAERDSSGGEKTIHDRLIDRPIDAPVSMPDGSRLALIRVPGFIKAQYLRRLNISRQLDPRVAASIETGVPAALGPVVKVRLRNAGPCLASGRRVLLCRFFERMTDSDPDYLACLDLLLSILDTAGGGDNGYELLAGYKRSLFRSLRQAGRFETLLRRSNMETLMLQGVRAPHASPGDLMHRMRLIDQICFGIFGKTEIIEPPTEEPVRQVSDLSTPGAAIRSLMR